MWLVLLGKLRRRSRLRCGGSAGKPFVLNAKCDGASLNQAHFEISAHRFIGPHLSAQTQSHSIGRCLAELRDNSVETEASE
jgi:hypothetical protein